MKKKIAITILVGVGLLLSYSVLGFSGNWGIGDNTYETFGEVEHNENLNFGSTTDFKIEGWFKPVSESANFYFNKIPYETYDVGWEFALIFCTPHTYWWLTETDFINEMSVDCGGSYPACPVSYEIDNWYFFEADRIGKEISFYLNGNLVGTDENLAMGSIDNLETIKLEGIDVEFDDFKIYREGELIAYWDFNEGEGIIAYDKINDYDFNLTGDFYWFERPLPPPPPFLELTDSFPAGIISYVRAFVGSGLAPLLAIFIGIPFAFVVIKKVITLVPKK